MDATGNRTSHESQAGTGNRLAEDATYTYQYDAEGNRIRRTVKATGAYETYTWDHRNRLVRVEFRTAANVLTQRVRYDYDAFDNLIRRRVDADGDGVFDRDERFVYDGGDLVLKTDANGNVLHRYLHGPGYDELFADEDALNEILWALSDHQGTVKDWIEHDAGTGTTTVADHLEYDAYGNIVSQTDPNHVPPVGFTGQHWDADVGLYYYSAGIPGGRWYDPVAGRFLKPDDAGFAAGDANLYRYVGNGPGNWVDPTGMLELNVIGNSIVGFGQGLGQGAVNIANGLQDTGVGLVNLGAAGVNGIACLEEQAGILDPNDPLRIPYLESPDWSKGLVVEENDTAHDVSKIAGAGGVEVLTGAAIARLAKLRAAAQCVTPARLPQTLSEVGLPARIRAAGGASLREAGEFFGWKPSHVTKGPADFTKESLLGKGWTRERLLDVAEGYEHIARITPGNPSAAGRASQLRDIAARIYGN